MGGFSSGRHGGRPTVEAALTIDLALMFRRGWIKDGSFTSSRLIWRSCGEQIATISYQCSLSDREDASLKLTYRNKSSGEWVNREQRVMLSYTLPNYGGRRWWMHCPVSGRRVCKLHLPAGGDIFASQKAWTLGYRSQRVTERDRVFERLFRLQRKLGSEEGWEAGLSRPKGMHRLTFERHLDRYIDLEEQCDAALAPVMAMFLKQVRR